MTSHDLYAPCTLLFVAGIFTKSVKTVKTSYLTNNGDWESMGKKLTLVYHITLVYLKNGCENGVSVYVHACVALIKQSMPHHQVNATNELYGA